MMQSGEVLLLVSTSILDNSFATFATDVVNFVIDVEA